MLCKSIKNLFEIKLIDFLMQLFSDKCRYTQIHYDMGVCIYSVVYMYLCMSLYTCNSYFYLLLFHAQLWIILLFVLVVILVVLIGKYSCTV